MVRVDGSSEWLDLRRERTMPPELRPSVFGCADTGADGSEPHAATNFCFRTLFNAAIALRRTRGAKSQDPDSWLSWCVRYNGRPFSTGQA